MVLAVLMALSVMAGTGGGGIIVPLLMAFYDLNTKQAISISGFTILVGALTRFCITVDHQIELGLASVMLPTLLMGSLCGVITNQAFAETFLQISLCLILSVLAIDTGIKAVKLHRRE